ncbi:MAG: 3-hydroxyacyl-CoA dehydrogenase [Hyphomicrobiaceae bacterium]|nr:MAG: 3-hydroxyacyl-CoA dehydrogenase [Hyphomicrobiaceae bacterium]
MAKVAMIGVGLIGRAWASVFARAGRDVVLWDPDRAALAAAPELIAQSLHDVARHGLAKDPAAAAGRITVAATLEAAVKDAAFVQESGPERLDVKLETFARLDAAAPASAILASSSSAIVASRFTEKLAGRHRCLIAHPVNPPHVVPIVELCGAPWTAPDTIKRARAVYEDVGQVPIVVKKEIDGFILNRMQAVLLSEAFRLVGEGYVSAEDLDKTIRDGLGLRWAFMGPFETIELNAPGGIPDYCARYGETLLKLSSAPVTPAVWGKDNVARATASWGLAPSGEDILKKQRWRDDRIAALVAHKRSQPKSE